MMREAGKSASNAIAEVREAVDFLRYYADQAEALGPDAQPLGTVVCISPWNFPLSIFTGQIAAALAAGNAVLAKPAEETPLTAAAMVAILHEAGVPRVALQFLPGAGDVGASLCAHPDVAGVVFTGSTEVARLIQKQLAPRGAIPLIAETGGINAMIVDSSALTEQVVNDVLSSAFDSAGQRCSALRLLCLQDDVADRTLAMLKGAMLDLRVGNPAGSDRYRPGDHRRGGRTHHRSRRRRCARPDIASRNRRSTASNGTFVPPTLIELIASTSSSRKSSGRCCMSCATPGRISTALIEAINALGFGLTFGLHTRLDETIDCVTARISRRQHLRQPQHHRRCRGRAAVRRAGLSGTGPKAGGPLYVRRLVRQRPADNDHADLLPGPVGESNLYRTAPRGEILLLPQTREGLSRMLDAVAATRNTPVIDAKVVGPQVVRELAPLARLSANLMSEKHIDGVLVEGDAARVAEVAHQVALLPGKIVPVQSAADVNRDMLVHEVSVSINTAAAGGNASLMALKES